MKKEEKEMNSKHTREQIEEAICRWSAYLLENKLATESEVKSIIGESWFKRAKTGLKNVVKGIGKGIASGVKAVGRSVHDFFTANKGVSQLMDAVNMLWIDGQRDEEDSKDRKIKDNKYAGKLKPDKIKFMVFNGSKVYPVVKFILSKNKKALAALYDKENSKPTTFEELKKLLEQNKVIGKGRHISDFVDALIIGKLEEDTAAVSEAELLEADSLKRLDAVLDAMQWSAETAKKPKNVSKLAQLLGVSDKKVGEMVKRIEQHFELKKDVGAGDEAAGEKPEFDGEDEEKKPEKSKKQKNEEDKARLEASENDYLIKTTDGSMIGVKDNPFKRVDVDGSYIGLIFNKSKAEQKDIEDTRASLKH